MNIMKIICLAGVSVSMVSCVTTSETAKTADFTASTYSATIADLKVSPERVKYTMVPSKEIQRGGPQNVRRAAISEALEVAEKNDGKKYDIMVEPEFVTEETRTFFTKKITKISVSGRPASYANFHSLNDSVWSNPVFRGAKVIRYENGRPVAKRYRSLGRDRVGGENSELSQRGWTFEPIVSLGYAYLTGLSDHGYVEGAVTYSLGFDFKHRYGKVFSLSFGATYRYARTAKHDNYYYYYYGYDRFHCLELPIILHFNITRNFALYWGGQITARLNYHVFNADDDSNKKIYYDGTCHGLEADVTMPVGMEWSFNNLPLNVGLRYNCSALTLFSDNYWGLNAIMATFSYRINL